MKAIIACGGTGGHLFPGLAVAEQLRAASHEVRLLVSEKAIESTWLAGWRNAPTRSATVEALPSIGWAGGRRLIAFCSRFVRATRQCAQLYRDFDPDVILGMGGYTSAPAVAAARWCGRKRAVILHESNAIPGRANRWSSRYADWVAVGWRDCGRYFRRNSVTVTGTPIRAQLRLGQRVAAAKSQLGLDDERQTVLVMGGSQGAHGLNDAMINALPWLRQWHNRVQFVHLSGAQDETRVRAAYRQHDVSACVMRFCHEMEWAYSAADLVVARAGAATLTEVAAFGLAAILVPYPHAADNHQWHNARVFERAGAAVVMEERTLRADPSGQRLAETMMELLTDVARRERMGRAARELSRPDATERVVELLRQCASGRPARCD